MSGLEEDLYARAEMLDETSDLAQVVIEVLTGAEGAGFDPGAVGGLRAAAQALDPAGGLPGYDAGTRFDRHPGTGFRSDVEFLEATWEAACQVKERLDDVSSLQQQVDDALEKAGADLQHARDDLKQAEADLDDAYALPTDKPCDGCHDYKASMIRAAQAAIADAERRIRDAQRRIGILEDADEILDELEARLQAALRALRRVPSDLGEEYELVYAHIVRGGKLPYLGRSITGMGPSGPALGMQG